MKRNFILSGITIAACTFLTHCAQPSSADGAPVGNFNVNKIQSAKPRYLPKSRYGNPASYVVNGTRYYVLKTAQGYNRTGIASWYGTKFHGRLTSTREPYNMYAMTAASPNLPIPCFVRVTNLSNNKHIIVKVNDRGPFAQNRIIDLSWAAATKLGFTQAGTALVRVTALDVSNPAPLAHPNPKLYLQLGAFHNRDNATHLQHRAQAILEQNVNIKTIPQLMGRLYRVQVGPIVSVQQSDKLLEQLTHAGYHNVFSVVD